MKQTYTVEKIKHIVEDETGFEYKLIEVDKNAKRDPLTNKEKKRMMTLEHLKCGHRYTLDIYEFIHGKRRCANCVKGRTLNEHFSFTVDEIVMKTDELTKGEYSFIDDTYHNSNTLHKYKHHLCGTIFEKKWNKFKFGQRCTKCYKFGMDSMASGYLQDILEFYNVDYEAEKKFKDCINLKTSKKLPFDYFIEKSRLLIEVDGEQHYRPSYGKNTFAQLKKRDAIKTNYAKENGYTLIRIPAKDFNRVPEYAAEVLSKYFNKSIDVTEVSQVKQSTNIDRVNKNLEKIRNGEYSLYDNFYTGVDRKHLFIHKSCGNKFESTVSSIKTKKYPCQVCKKGKQMYNQFCRLNEKLKKHKNGRYQLMEDDMRHSNNSKWLTKCNKCGHIWYVNISNILYDKGGCPHCMRLSRWEHWQKRFHDIEQKVSTSKKLSISDYNWRTRNRKLFKEKKLDEKRNKLISRMLIIKTSS